jgi:hypothetical protein
MKKKNFIKYIAGLCLLATTGGFVSCEKELANVLETTPIVMHFGRTKVMLREQLTELMVCSVNR